eukprot:COSAG06_NODE_2350_length_7028_cov_5.760572_3_plen_144_part_00
MSQVGAGGLWWGRPSSSYQRSSQPELTCTTRSENGLSCVCHLINDATTRPFYQDRLATTTPKTQRQDRFLLQLVYPDGWPAWGNNDLNMGDKQMPLGSEALCCFTRRIGVYNWKDRGVICGDRTGDDWGKIDMEVWRLKTHYY